MMFDPNKRCTINEALAHPYLANFHNPEDEPEALKVDPLDFEFEQHNLTLQQLKDLIYEEILHYHFEDFRKQYAENKAKGISIT